MLNIENWEGKSQISQDFYVFLLKNKKTTFVSQHLIFGELLTI